MLNKLRSTQGFTLIELLIVVAIIGILAAIAIPQFTDYKKRSRDGSSVSDIRNFKTAMMTLNNDTGYYSLVGTTVSFTGGASGATTLTSLAASGQTISFQPSNGVTIKVITPAALTSTQTFAATSVHASGSKSYGVNDATTVVYWKNGTAAAAAVSSAAEDFTSTAWQSM